MRRGPALLLLAVLAAGCSGGGDKPAALPTLTPAPSATPSAAPVPPQATANTSQSLDAFVRFYFQQLNVAISTGDSALIRQHSSPVCDSCRNFEEAIDANPDRLVRGTTFTISDVAVPPLGATGTIVDVFGTTPARDAVTRDGTLIEHLPPGGRFSFEVRVVRTGASWTVYGIRKLVQK